MTNFADVASEAGTILFTVGMVVGGTLGYVAQIRVFHHFQSSDGFSPLVSIILLVANTLRIFYWLGAPFAKTLLAQAIVMAFVQMVLIMAVLQIAQNQRISRILPGGGSRPASPVETNPILKLKRKMEEKVDYVLTLDAAASVDDIDAKVRKVLPIGIHPSSVPPSATNRASANSRRTSPTTTERPVDLHNNPGSAFPLESDSSDSSTMSATEQRLFGFLAARGITQEAFLKLSPADFVLFYILGCFCVGLFILGCAVVLGSDVYQVVGYFALGIEATFLLPQVYLNYSRKSCEGLTAILLITWVGGDTIKQIYYFYTNQPDQFIMCGFLLLCCDAAIVAQLLTYRHAHPRTDAERGIGAVL